MGNDYNMVQVTITISIWVYFNSAVKNNLQAIGYEFNDTRTLLTLNIMEQKVGQLKK